MQLALTKYAVFVGNLVDKDVLAVHTKCSVLS